VYTDINLTYDFNGNVTLYDDSAGYRHQKYYAAMDKLDRLRCLSRATISSCAGTEPWESKFDESFDYDLSGNRTNRRYGAFNTSDDDAYTYVSGPTDVIDLVTSGGASKSMSNDFKGDITAVNQPAFIQFTFDYEGRVTDTNDATLGSAVHFNTYFGDRYAKKSPCSAMMTRYYYHPEATGASSRPVLIDAYGTCASEYPREFRTFIYLEGRAIATVQSQLSNLGTHADTGTFWLHSDVLGSPVLVTNSSRVERWRWENDPFGRQSPVEYTVSSADVNPDDTSLKAGAERTCCCGTCGVSGCDGNATTTCASNCCDGGDANGLVWSKDYTPASATNVRVHFSTFDVKAGATRTAKDYLVIQNNADQTIATLTGTLGDFWGPWTGDSKAKLRLYADNVADAAPGFVVDKLEYTTATNGKFVMHLRMPGQVWEDEARHSYNYQRWYRAEDGRYVSPDPIGLAGGEPGYSAYVNSNPLRWSDPSGLIQSRTYCQDNPGAPGCPSTRPARRTPPGTPVQGVQQVDGARPGCIRVAASAIMDLAGPPPTTCSLISDIRGPSPYCSNAFARSGATGRIEGGCSGGVPYCEVCGCDNLRRLAGRHTYCRRPGETSLTRESCFGVTGVTIVDEPDQLLCASSVCQETELYSLDSDGVRSGTRRTSRCY